MAAANGANVFYDIGANVGSWSLLCKALVPDSDIVAFEPLPNHYGKFEGNLKAHRKVQLCKVALGPNEEMRPLLVTSYSDASSFLPLNQTGAKLWNIENTQQVEVPVVKLDTYKAKLSLPDPDFIKLDVQGFELAVLQGATDTLKSANWVLSEVSFHRFYENQVLFCELAAFLGSHGFEVYAFGHSLKCGQPQNQVDVLFRRIRA